MSSLPSQSAASPDVPPRVRTETVQPRMAKVESVDLRKAEKPSEREQKEAYGRLLKAVQYMLGKNLNEMAELLNVDPRQLSRWYAGTEQPAMWRWHAIPKVRRTLRLAEAIEDSEGCEVRTVITAPLDLGER